MLWGRHWDQNRGQTSLKLSIHYRRHRTIGQCQLDKSGYSNLYHSVIINAWFHHTSLIQVATSPPHFNPFYSYNITTSAEKRESLIKGTINDWTSFHHNYLLHWDDQLALSGSVCLRRTNSKHLYPCEPLFCEKHAQQRSFLVFWFFAFYRFS